MRAVATLGALSLLLLLSSCADRLDESRPINTPPATQNTVPTPTVVGAETEVPAYLDRGTPNPTASPTPVEFGPGR